MELYKKEILTPYTDSRGSIFNPIDQLALFEGNISDVHLFSAKKGAIRGNHYHENRNEKFWVIKGTILFVIKNTDTNTIEEMSVSANENLLIEIFPKIPHALKNIADEEAYVLCYSNHKSKTPDKNPIKEILIEN